MLSAGAVAAQDVKAQRQSAAEAKAADADEQVKDLEKELQQAKAKAAKAEKAMVQHLSGAAGEEPADPSYETGSEGDDWKPTFYEDYYHGRLGPLAESKRIPEVPLHSSPLPHPRHHTTLLNESTEEVKVQMCGYGLVHGSGAKLDVVTLVYLRFV